MADEHADFVAKLRQIEDAAFAAGTELPDGGPVKSQIRHIALIARTLRGRLEMGYAAVVGVDPKPPSDEEKTKLPG